MSATQLSTIPAEYIRTVNSHDAVGFIALFANDATVNDAGREIHGINAIRRWSESDIFAVYVSLELLEETLEDDTAVFTAKVDGEFDRTGLPNPLIIAHRFALADGKITQLTCALAE